MSFQNKVNLGPARGWHGDFASTNPRLSVFTGGAFHQQQFAAGSGGIVAGSFVWFDEATRTINNKGTGKPDGFVGREQTGLLTQYLQEYSMGIPAGFMVTAYNGGEFLVELAPEIGVVNRRDHVFVDPTTGKIVDATAKEAVETNYYYAQTAKGGDLVAISSWIQGK